MLSSKAFWFLRLSYTAGEPQIGSLHAIVKPSFPFVEMMHSGGLHRLSASSPQKLRCEVQQALSSHGKVEKSCSFNRA